jgi:hypothetical protein
VEELHRELAQIAFSAGEDLGLMLAGGYAIRAHGLTEPVLFDLGPVLTLDDAVGLKVRPLRDRALHRDFIDVHAAAAKAGYTWSDLERLGARHTPNWSLEDLADRLSAIELRDDIAFFEYGLTEEQVAELRRWCLSWADDIQARLAAVAGAVHEPTAARDWDAYLDE